MVDSMGGIIISFSTPARSIHQVIFTSIIYLRDVDIAQYFVSFQLPISRVIDAVNSRFERMKPLFGADSFDIAEPVAQRSSKGGQSDYGSHR